MPWRSGPCLRPADDYVANRYMLMLHGVGFVDEYPTIPYVQDYADWGYDGMFEENKVVSVESYIGEERGADGIKLEQQVLITRNGAKPLSHAPMDGLAA